MDINTEEIIFEQTTQHCRIDSKPFREYDEGLCNRRLELITNNIQHSLFIFM